MLVFEFNLGGDFVPTFFLLKETSDNTMYYTIMPILSLEPSKKK